MVGRRLKRQRPRRRGPPVEVAVLEERHQKRRDPRVGDVAEAVGERQRQRVAAVRLDEGEDRRHRVGPGLDESVDRLPHRRRPPRVVGALDVRRPVDGLQQQRQDHLRCASAVRK